jgi:hypothetical protein
MVGDIGLFRGVKKNEVGKLLFKKLNIKERVAEG